MAGEVGWPDTGCSDVRRQLRTTTVRRRQRELQVENQLLLGLPRGDSESSLNRRIGHEAELLPE